MCHVAYYDRMENDMANTRFGKRLAELRQVAGLSQPELAEKSGISVGGIRGIEQGRRDPTWETVLALAEALGVSVAEFQEKKPKGKKK